MQRLPQTIQADFRFIKELTCGESHFVAVLGNGQIVGSGSNAFGQLGLPFKGENSTELAESLVCIDLQGYNTVKDYKILQLASGKNHTVMVVKNIRSQAKQIIAFGDESGIGIEKVPDHTHIPQEIVIPKLDGNKNLTLLYARYNTTMVADQTGRVFMWGEDAQNLRLRKPKYLYTFTAGVKQIALGKRHGIVIDNEYSLYGWGDGTYGELGTVEDLPIEKPMQLPFFKDIKVTQIAAGARHSLALDREGNIFAMGDNSEDQCGISGRRATVPEKILKDFKVGKLFSGDAHNIAVSEDDKLYSWGGSVINTSWVKQSSNESKLRLMEEYKGRKVSKVDLAYSNTIIITGQ